MQSTEIARLLAKSVRQARQEKGVSKNELARRVGRSAIYRLEAGDHVPGLELMIRVADALGVTVTSLLVVLDEARSAERSGANQGG